MRETLDATSAAIGILIGAGTMLIASLTYYSICHDSQVWECQSNGGTYTTAQGCLVQRDDGSFVAAKLCVSEERK